MKKLFFLAVLVLAGCTNPLTPNQTFLVQQACMQDAIVRPIVTGLMILATPAEVDAVRLAETNIDVVCANPSAAPDVNAQAAFSAGIAKITSIEATLLAKQAAK